MRDLTLKAFKEDNGRIVTIAEEIHQMSYVQFKKDLYDIITSDESAVNENYNELLTIDKSVADAYKKALKFPPIYIDICSEGGSVYHGLGMYDIIRKVVSDKRRTVIVRLDGIVASAATVVMLACDERIASPHTSFLVHSVSGLTLGTVTDIKDELAEMERLSATIKKIYLSRTNLTMAKLEEVDKLKQDWWLTADAAKEFGLITEIS